MESLLYWGGGPPLFMRAEAGPGLWAAWVQEVFAVFTGRRGRFLGAGLRPRAVHGPLAGLGLSILTSW